MRAYGFVELFMLLFSVGQEILWAEMQNWYDWQNYFWAPDLILAIQTFLIVILLSPIPNIPRIIMISLNTILEIGLAIVFIVTIIPQQDPLAPLKIASLLIMQVAEVFLYYVSFKVHEYSHGDSDITIQARYLYAYSCFLFAASFLFGFMPNFCPIGAYNISSVIWSRGLSAACAITVLPITIDKSGNRLSICLMIVLSLSMTVMFALNATVQQPIPTGDGSVIMASMASLFQEISGSDLAEVGNEVVIYDNTPLALSVNELMFCYAHTIIAACNLFILPMIACACGLIFGTFAGFGRLCVALGKCFSFVGGELKEGFYEVNEAMSTK